MKPTEYSVEKGRVIQSVLSPDRLISEIRVIAERPVAESSPDHIMPWGTKWDSSRNGRFNQKLYRLYGWTERTAFAPLRVLDMGCSGGGFVRDCIDHGCLAVGLEGSDYSKKLSRAEWAVIPQFLFTCDISAPFRIEAHDSDGWVLEKFDVITSWEVLEHIPEDCLPILVKNVLAHMSDRAMWITSISTLEEYVGGYRIHQTVKSKEWWIQRLSELGLQHHPEYIRYFNTQFVRDPGSGGFHLALAPADNRLPPIPAESFLARLEDRWFSSRPQKILQHLITGTGK
jgi:SAM-dependent methyltransferase